MNEDKNLLCIGISDQVYDKNDKLIGYVGFHDYDDYIPRKELELKVCEFSNITKTTIDCLKTGYGYHFVSFEIFDDKKYDLWKEISQKIFPSDFMIKPAQGKSLDRVLRLSPKGNTMKPTWMFRDYQLLNPINISLNPISVSSGHIEAYIQSGIFDMNIKLKEVFTSNFFKPVVTNVRLCAYLTRYHGDKEKEKIEENGI